MGDDDEVIRRAQRRLGTVLREKYRVDRVLGIGGMAVVYVVTHRNQKRFALKMLHAELSSRADIRLRFQREGYAANSVEHPGVVAVIDDDVAEDGSAFLVMELLDGVSVEQLLERAAHRLPIREAAALTYELLDVLATAHDKGVVHRDIKPANLFLTTEGRLKVLDFGIARVRDAALSDGPHTSDGTILGTPAFMAPEQALARARDIDPRTDLWAAGATMFTLCSGTSVHVGETTQELLIRAATVRARPMQSVVPGAPSSIARVVDRALEFERDARWGNAAQMRDALANAFADDFGEFRPRDLLAGLSADQLPSERSAPSSNAQPQPVNPAGQMPAATPATGSVVDEEASVAGLPGKPRRFTVVGIAATVMLAGAAFFAVRAKLAQGSIAKYHANVIRCLIGEPLATGENATGRFRAIQLAAVGAPSLASRGEAPWPARCSGRASELAHTLEEQGGRPELAAASRVLASSLQDFGAANPSHDMSAPVGDFFRASAASKLASDAASADVIAPPTMLRAVLDLDKPTFAAPQDLQRTSRSPFIHSSLDFLLQPSMGTPELCHWAGSDRLDCKPIPTPAAAMMPGLQLWGTTADGVAPFLFAGSRGKMGIFRSDTGERVVDSIPFDGAYGAFSARANTLDYLEWQDGSPHMLLKHVAAGERISQREALDKEPIRFPYFSTELAWGWLAYRAQVGDELHLFVRRLESGGTFDTAQDVASMPEGGMVEKDDRGEPHMSGCKSGESIVLRLKGYDRQFLVFRAADRWTPPAIAPHMTGSLTCAGATAVITTATWGNSFGGITKDDCSLSECKVTSNQLLSLAGTELTPRSRNDVASFDVNGKTLLIWYAGIAGGLRMRYAPIDQLDATPDIVLFDDHLKDGAFTRDSSYGGFRAMHTSESAVLLLLQTPAGVHAFAFNNDGSFSKVERSRSH